MELGKYETIRLDAEDSICYLTLNRPEAGNTINDRLIAECNNALSLCESMATIVVLSGSGDNFCLGADFSGLNEAYGSGKTQGGDPGPLYDLWLRLAHGPYVSISHVQGKANAGGIGFVAASDIVLAGESAQFSLSELLFGLYPACVMPFLVRRVGLQKAHYLTLMTQPITADQANECGLADAVEAQSELLLKRHIQRLRRLSKRAIRAYKSYMCHVGTPLRSMKEAAVDANIEMFSDPINRQAITDYVQRGAFPWESRS